MERKIFQSYYNKNVVIELLTLIDINFKHLYHFSSQKQLHYVRCCQINIYLYRLKVNNFK